MTVTLTAGVELAIERLRRKITQELANRNIQEGGRKYFDTSDVELDLAAGKQSRMNSITQILPCGGDTVSGPQRCEVNTRMEPVQVVQEFIDAFNARDVDRVVGCFSTDAVMQNDAGAVFAQGAEAIRAHFGGFLPHSPNVHSEIRSHIHVGSWVVQEEHVTGLVLGEPVPEFSIPSAYRVEDGKIVKCIGLQ